MSRAGTIARRTFLVATGAIGAGVAVGAWGYLRDPGNPMADALPDDAASPNAFVMITGDGITLVTPRVDVGQGAASIQAHLLAEELDVNPHTVTLSPGPASPVYWNGAVAAEALPFAAWADSMTSRFVRGRGGLRARGAEASRQCAHCHPR